VCGLAGIFFLCEMAPKNDTYSSSPFLKIFCLFVCIFVCVFFEKIKATQKLASA